METVYKIEVLQYLIELCKKSDGKISETRIKCLSEIIDDLEALSFFVMYYIMNEPKDGYETYDYACIRMNTSDGAFKEIQNYMNKYNI